MIFSSNNQKNYDRYHHARNYLPENLRHKLLNVTIFPIWVSNKEFIYKEDTDSGYRFMLVDCYLGKKVEAFDHNKFATVLSESLSTRFDPNYLPLENIGSPEEGIITFNLKSTSSVYSCDLREEYSTPVVYKKINFEHEVGVLSPCKRWWVKQRSGNLFIIDSDEKREEMEAITDDGSLDNGYGCYNPFAVQSGQGVQAPVVYWSADSRYLAVQRVDVKSADQITLTQLAVDSAHEEKSLSLSSSYPFFSPGDKQAPMSTTYIFDISDGKRLCAKMGPVPIIETLEAETIIWGEDNYLYQLVFSRGQQSVSLYSIDPLNGSARVVLEECSPTFLAGPNQGYRNILQILPDSREFIWCSEQEGVSSLYLYDLDQGACLRRLTRSNLVVTYVHYVDQCKRQIYFSAGNTNKDVNPYHQAIYSVGLDGAQCRLLTPESGFHDCPSEMSSIYRGLFCTNPASKGFSPAGEYFIDSFGDLEKPSTTVLRLSETGEVILPIVDVVNNSNTTPPKSVCVNACDDSTTLYGALFLPGDFEPKKKYPVILSIYGAPQFSFVPKFQDEIYTYAGGSHWALAELGFIVLVMDPRGTPMRGKQFHDYIYGRLDNGGGIDDQVYALRQLAKRYTWMDIERVGVVGISGGGYAAANAMLNHPDIFKAGVSISGNHDQCLFHYSWAETYHGLVPSKEYKNLANKILAKKLKGKLLLMHGDADAQVHPINTYQLYAAFIDNNIDVEFKLLPNRGHFLAEDPYLIRQTWVFLVRHLLES